MEQLKMKTYMAWINCFQRNLSPVDFLYKKGIKEVIVYGVTDLGEKFVTELLNKNYPIKAIVDGRIISGGYDYRGIPIISKSVLISAKYRDVCVIVTAMAFWNEIKVQLKEQEITNIMSLLELME